MMVMQHDSYQGLVNLAAPGGGVRLPVVLASVSFCGCPCTILTYQAAFLCVIFSYTFHTHLPWVSLAGRLCVMASLG